MILGRVADSLSEIVLEIHCITGTELIRRLSVEEGVPEVLESKFCPLFTIVPTRLVHPRNDRFAHPLSLCHVIGRPWRLPPSSILVSDWVDRHTCTDGDCTRTQFKRLEELGNKWWNCRINGVISNQAYVFITNRYIVQNKRLIPE